jgi:hypothetical protein
MDIDRYDLVVNTGVLDLDTCVDVIVAAYQAKIARATRRPPDHSRDVLTPSQGVSMKKLTYATTLGYAAGDLANNLAFSLQALFLLI